jgi:SM-20-related protein
MIDLKQIERGALSTQPYEWAFVGDLFAPQDAASLVASFPRDNFKTVYGYDAEKGFEYEARALVGMGADAASNSRDLSPAWRRLADDLLSNEYRAALSRLTGLDLNSLPMEVNVFHYGPGAWLGPHIDLKEKIATHVFYFNERWDEKDGGCLTVLRSSDASDAAASVAPVIGNSVVLMRSENSWHAVSPVARGCRQSRLSMTVTFYSHGSVSTMWPPDDATPLHHYDGANDAAARGAGLWRRLRAKVSSRLAP